MPLVRLPELLVQPSEWDFENGVWEGGAFKLQPEIGHFTWLLISPNFELTGGQLYTFSFSAEFVGQSDYVFGVHQLNDDPTERPHIDREIYSRLYEDVVGKRRFSLTFRAGRSGLHRVALRLPHCPENLWGKSVPVFRRVSRLRDYFAANRAEIRRPEIVVQTIGTGRVSAVPIAENAGLGSAGSTPTELAHWGRFKREIHRRCRESRNFNSLVSAIEMRLGREEVLSLPQCMALCPTGQCNALCDFCSVTVNRTGIVKKQLPYNKLSEFLAPVANTVRLFGLEGNGEPTLYAYFPELVDSVTRQEADAYLITNGSRLTPDNVPLLLGLASINFSLNAATAATHRRVMKLKNFDAIIGAIQALVRERGRPDETHIPVPQISVSFVVTADSIHETQEFLRLAEQDLGVDVIWIRPLADLANEFGIMEDVRRIVPYEADVRDMLDAVADYMRDVPRRAEIRIDPASFQSMQADPVGRVLMPEGFAGRLLAPRRSSWKKLDEDVVIEWHLNTARIVVPPVAGPILETEFFDIEPQQLTFRAAARVEGGPIDIRVVDTSGVVLGDLSLADSNGRSLPFSFEVTASTQTAVSLVVLGRGAASTVDIDFERLRTPAGYASTEFKIPIGTRWELCLSAAKLNWAGRTMSIASEVGGGPYLVKSYAIPCSRNSSIELPVNVHVRHGTMTIGFLAENDSRFLETFQFGVGRASATLFFDSGDNERVRTVVYAAPGEPVEASIEWCAEAAHDDDIEDRQRLPAATQWTACVRDAECRYGADRVAVSWTGTGVPYLLTSGKIRCTPHRQAVTSVVLEVREGEVGIGVLDASGRQWLAQATASPGEQTIELPFDTGRNTTCSIVLFALSAGPVEAEVDLISANSGIRVTGCTPSSGTPEQNAAVAWEESDCGIRASGQNAALVGQQEHKTGDLPSGERDLPLPEASRIATVAPTGVPQALWKQVLRWFGGRTQYRCQKPWTDLHNFTVDGRMDVCCIATGASQQNYQLGNLNQQAFQEIWNGPAARAFRRTVNSAQPLPPCERCPMHYAYEGAAFDPGTADRFANRVRRRVVDKTRSRALADVTAKLLGSLVKKIVFRGFSTAPRWSVPVGLDGAATPQRSEVAPAVSEPR